MSLKSLQELLKIDADGIFGKGTLKVAASYFELNDERAAHFFGQTGHETGNFKIFTENLNYSADGLLSIFKKYYPTRELAEAHARQPEKIANHVYCNRMGNGNEESGDGWKYRGRGALQLTGKSNYQEFAKFLENNDVLDNPDLVATTFSFNSAIFFFTKNKLWNICDKGVNDDVIKEITKKVNGGTHGLDDRLAKTKLYYSWIKG